MTGPVVVRVPPDAVPADTDRVRALLRAAGACGPVPVVVLVGGASGMGVVERERCAALVGGVLVPFVVARGVAIVDGGTDAGVMAIAGRARRLLGAGGLHVGVAAVGTVAPHQDPVDGRAEAEPHHTHLVLVPGGRWGDEVPWLGTVAEALAAGGPTVTVLANGGEIAREDVRASVDAGRPVLVLAGTGRTADDLAANGTTPQLEIIADAAALETALHRHLGDT